MNVQVAYHLLIFDSNTRHILVEWLGDKWLVPVFTYVGAQCQHPEALQVFVRHLGINAWPVHDAIVSDSSSTVTQGYCAYVANACGTAWRGTWLAIDQARQTHVCISVQRMALADCLERFDRPVSTFDSPAGAVAPEHWARSTLSACRYQLTGDLRVLRHTRDRRVGVWTTTSGDVYIKANARTVAHEVRVTNAMATAFPRQFARTVAVESVRGWWLYEGVSGTVLTPRRLTPQIGERIGASFATLQRRAMNVPGIRSALATRQFPLRDVMAVLGVARALADRFADGDDELRSLSTPKTWEHIEHAGADLECLPASFLHGDLWLPNIVEAGDVIALLDVEDAGWGPVVVSLWRLLDRLGRPPFECVAQRIVETYVRAWAGPEQTRIANAVQELEVIGRLLELKTKLDKAGFQPLDYARVVMQAMPTRPRIDHLKTLLRAATTPIVRSSSTHEISVRVDSYR